MAVLAPVNQNLVIQSVLSITGRRKNIQKTSIFGVLLDKKYMKSHLFGCTSEDVISTQVKIF